MPTTEEFVALYEACGGSIDDTTNPSGASASVVKGVYWCTSYDGVEGCLFCDGTNKLFFPAAGFGDGTSLKSISLTVDGFYLSSSLYSDDPSSAYFLYLFPGYVDPESYYSRSGGFSVRPVKDVPTE